MILLINLENKTKYIYFNKIMVISDPDEKRFIKFLNILMKIIKLKTFKLDYFSKNEILKI